MGRIDQKIVDIQQARLAAQESAQRERDAKRQRLLPCAREVFDAVHDVTRGNSRSWAIKTYLDPSHPCVTCCRTDSSSQQELAKFTFSESQGGIAVHLGNEYQLMHNAGASWAASQLIDRAASSFDANDVGIHPAIKWTLGIVGAFIALPIVIQLLIAAVTVVLTGFALVLGIGILLATMGLADWPDW